MSRCVDCSANRQSGRAFALVVAVAMASCGVTEEPTPVSGRASAHAAARQDRASASPIKKPCHRSHQAGDHSSHRPGVAVRRRTSRWLLGIGSDFRCGFIDRTGKVVIPPKYSVNRCMWRVLRSDELTEVYDEMRTGFTDGTGRLAIPLSLSWIERFSEGRAVLRDYASRKYGFVDRKGRVIIAPRFDQASAFSEGLAAVQIGRRHGYIDRSGRVVIAPRFTSAGPFREGLAVVRTARGYSAIDRCGRTVIAPRSQDSTHLAGSFREGRVRVERSGRPTLCGYADRTGRVVVEPRFEWCQPFSEGLAVVRYDPAPRPGRVRWPRAGFVDRSGRVVIPARFNRARRFSAGLAPVDVAGRWGFIDTRGKLVLMPRYTDAYPFRHGLALVAVKGEYRYIDRKGRTVWAPARIQGTDLAFRDFSAYSAVGTPKRQFLILRDEASYERYWAELVASRKAELFPPPGPLDFRTHLLIAVSQGSQGNGQYSIRIRRIVQTSSEIIVVVSERRPLRRGCALTMIPSRSGHLVVLPKQTKPFRFVVRVLDSC